MSGAQASTDEQIKADAPATPDTESKDGADALRVLHERNFLKALKEITPSASESLGTLSDLRKWNEEFGEGRKKQKSMRVWGRDMFGFTIKAGDGREEGMVRTLAHKR